MGRSTNKTWEFRHKHGNVSYTKQAFGSNQQEVQISKGYLKTAAIIFQPCRLHWLELQTWDDLAMSPGFYEFTQTHTHMYIYISYIYDTISFESFSLHPDTTKLQATVFTPLCRNPVVHTRCTGWVMGTAAVSIPRLRMPSETEPSPRRRWDLGVGPMAPWGTWGACRRPRWVWKPPRWAPNWRTWASRPGRNGMNHPPLGGSVLELPRFTTWNLETGLWADHGSSTCIVANKKATSW